MHPTSQVAPLREVHTSDSDALAIRAWCDQRPPYQPEEDCSLDFADLRQRARELPECLQREARQFGRHLGTAGVLVLRGLPLRELPATPPAEDDEPTTGTESLLFALALLAGQLPSFGMYGANAYGGRRLHNLYALPTDSTRRLSLHTELLNYSRRPDALVLLCLRDGPGPPSANLFCDMRLVWDRLDERDRARLQQRQFRLAALGEELEGPSSVGCAPVDLRPVVSWWRGRQRFTFMEGTVGATAEHQDTLGRVMEHLTEVTVEIPLAPGDAALIDNVHVLHGRSPLSPPRHDGTDRWLQRCYVQRGRST
jgi:L-asparagine oxygenase